MTQAPDQRPRLLLVDDEPTNLQVLRHILQADYRLLFATDGERALQVAREQRPDLILLDVMMPHLDGYAVCRAQGRRGHGGHSGDLHHRAHRQPGRNRRV